MKEDVFAYHNSNALFSEGLCAVGRVTAPNNNLGIMLL